MTRRTFASSSIRFDLVCRRPAVSAMTMSAWRAMAASRASNTTAAGSALGAWATISRVRALGPDPQLVDGGGAERVGGGEHDAPAVGALARGELADGRGLAGPVDADDEHDRRAALDGRAWAPSAPRPRSASSAGELGADGRLGATVATLARPLDDVHRQRGADVAGDQDLLDLVPVGAVAAAERAAQPGAEPGPRLLEALLELLALALAAGGVGLLGAVVGAPGPLDLGLRGGLGCTTGATGGQLAEDGVRLAGEVELERGRLRHGDVVGRGGGPATRRRSGRRRPRRRSRGGSVGLRRTALGGLVGRLRFGSASDGPRRKKRIGTSGSAAARRRGPRGPRCGGRRRWPAPRRGAG